MEQHFLIRRQFTRTSLGRSAIKSMDAWPQRHYYALQNNCNHLFHDLLFPLIPRFPFLMPALPFSPSAKFNILPPGHRMVRRLTKKPPESTIHFFASRSFWPRFRAPPLTIILQPAKKWTLFRLGPIVLIRFSFLRMQPIIFLYGWIEESLRKRIRKPRFIKSPQKKSRFPSVGIGSIRRGIGSNRLHHPHRSRHPARRNWISSWLIHRY
jgi:hypothetical protein